MISYVYLEKKNIYIYMYIYVVVVGFKYHEYHPLATPQKEFCEDTILPIFGVQKGWSATRPPISGGVLYKPETEEVS